MCRVKAWYGHNLSCVPCVGVIAMNACVSCECVWVVRDTAWTLPLAVCCIGPLLVVDGVAGEVVAVHAVDAMVKS